MNLVEGRKVQGEAGKTEWTNEGWNGQEGKGGRKAGEQGKNKGKE